MPTMMLIMALPVVGLVLFAVLPMRIAVPGYVAGLALAGFYHWLMMTAMRRPVTTGRRGMIGMSGRVLSWEAGAGEIRCHGEIWTARTCGATPLAPGDRVGIVAVERMTLVVTPLPERRIAPLVNAGRSQRNPTA
jgi:membrane-bound ClpP family serine protease